MLDIYGESKNEQVQKAVKSARQLLKLSDDQIASLEKLRDNVDIIYRNPPFYLTQVTSKEPYGYEGNELKTYFKEAQDLYLALSKQNLPLEIQQFLKLAQTRLEPAQQRLNILEACHTLTYPYDINEFEESKVALQAKMQHLHDCFQKLPKQDSTIKDFKIKKAAALIEERQRWLNMAKDHPLAPAENPLARDNEYFEMCMQALFQKDYEEIKPRLDILDLGCCAALQPDFLAYDSNALASENTKAFLSLFNALREAHLLDLSQDILDAIRKKLDLYPAAIRRQAIP